MFFISVPKHLQNYGRNEEPVPGREHNRSKWRRNREGEKREGRWGEEEEENLKSKSWCLFPLLIILSIISHKMTITGWVHWNRTTFGSSMWRRTKKKILGISYPVPKPVCTTGIRKIRMKAKRRPIQVSLSLCLILRGDHARTGNSRGSTVISFS